MRYRTFTSATAIHRSVSLGWRVAVVGAFPLLVAACDGTPAGPDGGNEPTSVEVSLSTDSLEVGGTAQASASASGPAGPVAASFEWSSTNPSVATVDSIGAVTAVAIGSASIRAAVSGMPSLASTSDLVVIAPPGPSLAVVGPADDNVYLPAFTFQLTATGGVESLSLTVNGRETPIDESAADSVSAAVEVELDPGVNVVVFSATNQAGGVTRQTFELTRYRFQVQPLGNLGGAESEALGLNNQGVVVGRAMTPDGIWRAFVTENGQMVQLDTLKSELQFRPETVASDINDAGVIVGWDEIYAVKWVDGVPMEIGLGGLDGLVVSYGQAVGINEDGSIAGSEKDDCPRCPRSVYRVDRDTTILVAPNDGYRTYNQVYDINNEGTVAGAFAFDYDSLASFVYDSSFRSLGLGQEARGINNNGRIVGRVEYETYIIYEDGTPEIWRACDLVGVAPTNCTTLATSINDANLIVGNVGGGTGDLAFIRQDQEHAAIQENLIDSSWRIVTANAINEQGQIAANAIDPASGKPMAVLLTPRAE